MREDNHEIQTSKKEHLPLPSNRKAKQMNAASKKLHNQQQKSVKKNLSSVLNSVTEEDVGLNLPEKEAIEKFSISDSVDADQSTVEIGKPSLTSDQTIIPDKSVVLEHPEDSVEIATISEAFVFGRDRSNESIESYIVSLDHFASPTSVTPLSCDSPALSSITTVETTPFSSSITAEASPVHVSSGDGSTTQDQTDSFKLEFLVKHLRESMFEVLHSADIDPQYKKLLDSLVKMVIEEFFSLHEERDMVIHLFSRRIKIMMLCIIAVSSGFFLLSDGSSYNGPSPT
ncbi:uncharacterized protein LOC111896649 [Lactuca sativa]|uniref:Uncharacterized protein n=1 Tax=Lactuca sativa TaxID=4236 RepID=A0A9R1V8U3_LACSA|nr:uncharacterized protein LOC111896649 [Lactuca sativa]KAJ0201781.1 hypothetical protein LSAT_V11C600314390 [Lactuca sativa]